MTVTGPDLVEAHLDHPARIAVSDPARLPERERDIYDAVKSSPKETLVLGNHRARIQHRTSRRSVHWRQVVENLKGPKYAEEVLANTPPGDEVEYLIIEEL